MLAYPTIYRDARGEELTVIHNDGTTLRVQIRGVAFEGRSFDLLSPAEVAPESLRDSFTLQLDCLCACTIRCTMPIGIQGRESMSASLVAEIDLGEPTSNGRLSHERVRLHLSSDLGDRVSAGTSGWFEDELLDLNAQLGATAHIASCITCAYSDYSPVGHGLFGDMACFRDCKERYQEVRSKTDIFELWPLMTEHVQETYLCSDYLVRRRGTGYRG